MLQAATTQSNYAVRGIQAAKETEIRNLGNEKTDNGVVNNAGAVGFLNNTCKVVTGIAATAAVTAIAGPAAGAVVAAGFACKDGIASMGKSALNPEQGGELTLAKSLRDMQSDRCSSPMEYSNPDDDPICSHYVSSQATGNQNFVGGFFMPQNAMPAYLASKVKGEDTAEERKISDRIGALDTKLGDHDRQDSTARGLAVKIGTWVGEGPPPPKIAGSMPSAPSGMG